MNFSAPRSALPLTTVLGDEGFRLFFPLSALYAAIWPLLWVLVHGFDLPLARSIPPSIWHAHEMIIGAFGAALLGFITTAIPEWTDTERLRGPILYRLATLWGIGRIVGLLGADALGALGAIADIAWLGFLAFYVLRVACTKRTTRLTGFFGWLTLLLVFETITRIAFLMGNIDLAQIMTHRTGFAFMGLLGLALARVTVPVTNLVLDPSEESSPFRPHPGRLNLAPGLVVIALAGECLGISPDASGFLMIAAGAAFLDRVAEAFVGREAFRAEIATLATTSLLAGIGLLLIGVARLDGPVTEIAGLHTAFMGGLGLGVMSIFCIAGMMHTGQKLRFGFWTRLALTLCVSGTALRVLPDLGLLPPLPGPPYALASLVWASSFLIWLIAYWPALSDPATLDTAASVPSASVSSGSAGKGTSSS